MSSSWTLVGGGMVDEYILCSIISKNTEPTSDWTLKWVHTEVSNSSADEDYD